MNRSRSVEGVLDGTRERVASVDSEASTVRFMSTSLNESSAPAVITMQKLLNLQRNDPVMDVDLKCDSSSISTASDEVPLEHSGRKWSGRDQGVEDDTGRQSTDKLRREVDDYMTLWQQQQPGDTLTDLVNDSSVTSMDSWEKRIRDRLEGDVDSDGDNDFEEDNPRSNGMMEGGNEYVLRGGLSLQEPNISPIKEEESGSPTSPSGELYYFDQSRFDADADYALAVGLGEESDVERGQANKRRVNSSKRVQFAQTLVDDVQYRDYCESAEKPLLFYNHYEEQRFKMDHSRELERADALGLSWTEWMELRTDVDVAVDEENDASDLYADDSQFDYEDDDIEVEFGSDDCGDYRRVDPFGKTYIGRSYNDVDDDF